MNFILIFLGIDGSDADDGEDDEDDDDDEEEDEDDEDADLDSVKPHRAFKPVVVEGRRVVRLFSYFLLFYGPS